MSHTGHERVVCGACTAVVRQCRCADAKPERVITCGMCIGKPKVQAPEPKHEAAVADAPKPQIWFGPDWSHAPHRRGQP